MKLVLPILLAIPQLSLARSPWSTPKSSRWDDNSSEPPPGWTPPPAFPPTVLDPDGNKLGAVTSENPICSTIGTDVLKAGGTAADSTVATVLCVGVVGMYHSDIGGGGFMLVRASNGSYEFINFRETAPAAATQDMYNNNTEASERGGLSVGIPGELRGLERLHKHYGRLPWKDLVLPAARVAEYGFPVDADLVRHMDYVSNPNGTSFLVDDPNWAIDFAPNGTRLGLGDILTRKRYAATLQTIAEQGVDAFYQGPIAKATIAAIQRSNGIMTLADLKNYSVESQTPFEIEYNGYKVYGGPAPSSGAVVLSALKILDSFPDVGSLANVNQSTYLFDEAFRFAYGQRTELGDPSFVPGMVAYQQSMLSNATVNAVHSKINPQHTLNVSAYNPMGFESLKTPGTTAIAASDASGLVISLTTTINLAFGSRLLVPETGIILNDEMNDFSIPGSSNAFGYIPSPINFIRPGKRPLSSISPTIAETPDGQFYFTTSAAGGSRIITVNAQNMWHVLSQNFTAYQAVDAPRFHDQLSPNLVQFEYAYNNETVAYLQSKGLNVSWVNPEDPEYETAGVGILRTQNGTFQAAGEPRLNGSGITV